MKAKKYSTPEAHALVASTSHRLAKCLTALIAGLFAASSAWALQSCPVYNLLMSTGAIRICCIADQAGQYYELGQDLTTSGGTCIKISAPDVTFFGATYTITSTSSTPNGIGIHVLSTARNAVIAGSGKIEGFKTGFQTDAPNTFAADVVANLNERGMVFNGPNGFAFLDGASFNAENGITLTSAASGSYLAVPLGIANEGNGIVLKRTMDITVLGAVAEANIGYGLWLKGSSSNLVIGGDLEGNTYAGAYVGCHAGGPSPAPCAIPPSDNNTFTSSPNVLGGGINGLVVGSCPGGAPLSQPYGIVIDQGNTKNHVVGVTTDTGTPACTAPGDTLDDGYDGNLQHNCRNNIWYDNTLTIENHKPSLKHPGCMN